jgi:Predicted nucleotide-binding protein containing TIR-like domain
MPEVTRSAIEQRLAVYIEQGQDLLERASLVGDVSDYESWKLDRTHWVKLTSQGLAEMYGGPEEATRFKHAASPQAAGQKWQAEYAGDLQCVRAAIDILTLLRDPAGLADGRSEDTRLAPREDGARLASEPEDDPGLASEPAGDPGLASEPGDEARLPPQPASAPGLAPELSDEPAREPFVEVELEPARSAQSAPAEAPSAAVKFEPPPVEPTEQESAGGSALVRDSATGPDVASHGNGSVSSIEDPASSEPSEDQLAKRVFLVHGMNEKWKQAVVQLLELAGPHEVTILHERPSEGRTLIEQAAGSGYAIVLLTADEVGAARIEAGANQSHTPYYSPRARQSVVFEMGLLVGVLTPRYVCVLYERGVDLPSEVYGLAYVLLDVAGSWQSKLLMQLRSAGFDYDADKLASLVRSAG